MQQRIVIRVQLYSHQQRAKVMGIASAAYGVTSIAITGEANNQLEVKGEGVDSVKLTRSIRKKVSRDASIVRVEQVEPQPQPPADPQPQNQPVQIPIAQWGDNHNHHHPFPPPIFTFETVNDPSPPNCCTIM